MLNSTEELLPPFDIQAVAFDLDGTIAHSYRRGIWYIQEIAKMRAFPFTTETERLIRLHWGVPGAELLALCFDISIEFAREVYLDWNVIEKRSPVPMIRGAGATISMLYAGGRKLGLVTSRTREALTPTLERMTFGKLFHHTATKDETVGHKPDPKVFTCWLAYCARFGIAPHQTAYVGDGEVDIKAAKEAGMVAIAVETGPKHQLANVSPHKRFPTIASVGPWLLQQSTAHA